MYCVLITACDVKPRIGFSWHSIQSDLDHFKYALIGPDPNLKDRIRTSLMDLGCYLDGLDENLVIIFQI